MGLRGPNASPIERQEAPPTPPKDYLTADLPASMRRYLLDEIDFPTALAIARENDLAVGDAGDESWRLQWLQWPERCGVPTESQIWAQHGAELLAEFVSAHPGQRPRCWWLYEAPLADDGVSRTHPNAGETQAAFLDRHGLLLHGEEQQFTSQEEIR